MQQGSGPSQWVPEMTGVFEKQADSLVVDCLSEWQVAHIHGVEELRNVCGAVVQVRLHRPHSSVRGHDCHTITQVTGDCDTVAPPKTVKQLHSHSMLC